MHSVSHVEKLKALMDEYGKLPVCVAFSGGVDSSLLLKMACDGAQKHGNPVYAVTFDTKLHPACDTENARKVAKELKAEHVILKIDELELPDIQNNPADRCYICKKHLFSTLKSFAAKKNITCVLDGTNEDDLHVYRPGLRALKELRIESPLAMSGMTKAEVKALAAELGISAATRPSTPCMATRLPYGARLDYGLLKRIEEGEIYIRTLLTGNVRLRVHGEIARIEVDTAQLQTVLAFKEEIQEELKKQGFSYITLDLEGFRSGSMDVGID